ncbi:MAG: BatA and WFA domain-containing protein [Tepidisphaeraceae bacterium]
MNFLNPWAIGLGAAAIGLPIVVHLLTRPRPVRLPLSTLRFVLEAVHQRKARYRLRDILILAMRTLAVALLAWAFARPLMGVKPLIAAGAQGASMRVIVLDQSQSMAAVANAVSSFDRAKPVAAKFLGYQPGLKANLIFAASRPRATFAGLSENVGSMRDEIASAKPRAERLDVQAAINTAAEMLAKTPEGARREIVIISDFQRSNWEMTDFSPLPQDALIQLESVAPKQTPANLAILRVAAKGRIEQGREALLEADVANHSPAPREVSVEVTFGNATHRLTGLCPAGVTTTLSAPIVLKQAGWQTGEAKIAASDDALAADDSRPLVLHVRPMPAYALITREPATPRPSSSHFLERALVPFKPEEKSAERVIRIDPLHLDREAIAPAALIVIDHPGKLSVDSINLLAGLLRRGRGIFYVAAEPSDAINLKAIADAAGADLKMPVEFMPIPANQTRKDLFLTEVRKDEPPFREFGEQLPQVLGAMRFSGGLTSRRLETGLIDDVFATYSDRSACLVVTTCGAGTLAVLNADLAQSSLNGSPVFVPLVGELVGRLLSARGGQETFASGEPMTAYLPTEAGAIAGLTLPAKNSGALVEEGGFVLWRWPEAGAPGGYEVTRGNETVFAIASSIPAIESNLQTTDASLFTTRLAGGRTLQFQAAADEREQNDDAWSWILVACCVCTIGELALLKAFRT